MLPARTTALFSRAGNQLTCLSVGRANRPLMRLYQIVLQKENQGRIMRGACFIVARQMADSASGIRIFYDSYMVQ